MKQSMETTMIDQRRRHLVLFAVLASMPACLRAADPGPAQADIEQRKIDYLIAQIGALKDAHFIRNGTEYDAAKAVEHLERKRRAAGSRIRTAEQFITYVASASSMSGEKYRIRFASGEVVDAATFLHGKLAAYDLGAR